MLTSLLSNFRTTRVKAAVNVDCRTELVRLAAPAAGQRWLELGCGTGEFSRTIWESSRGKLAELTSVDELVEVFESYRRAMADSAFPSENRTRFLCCDYRSDLSLFQSKQFHRAIGGPSLLERAAGGINLEEIQRVLRCGGMFVVAIRGTDPMIRSIRGAGFERMETFPLPGSDVQLVRAWKVTECGNI